MFRRKPSQEGTYPDFDAGTEPLPLAGPQTTGQATSQQQGQQQSVAGAIALARQKSRRTSSDPASNDAVVPPMAGQVAPLRTRVQQQPFQVQQGRALPAVQQKAPTDASTASANQFTVFGNPLSADRQATVKQLAAVARDARQPALLQQPHETLQDIAAEKAPALPVSTPAEPELSAVAENVSSPVKHSDVLSKTKTLRFEVQPATDYHQQDGAIIDGNLDQQHLLGAADQQHSSAPKQQYVYNEDTGQLCRVGEGADTTRLARHYLEDWNTGDFFMMAEPSSGCMSWLRRKPRPGPSAWGFGGQREPNILHRLSEFTDNMGSIMAALGMFAQGMAGGLALLSFFMTYLQYATAGRDGLLAYYSALAQMVNRAFFTLISLSLVSASSRLAYDQLGNFKPSFLRLRVADGLVLALYLLAYVCNLIAAPIDDQLTFEARRDVNYWVLPQQQAFVRKVNLWQVLNLMRIICCGLAWALVSYRGNHMVMMMVFEARHQQQQQVEERLSSVGGDITSAAAAGDAWHQTSIAGFTTADQVECGEYRASNGLATTSPVRGARVLESCSSLAARAGHVQRQASRGSIGSGRMVGGTAGPGAVAASTAARGGLPPLGS